MIFVKDWSTLLQYLTMVRRFERLLQMTVVYALRWRPLIMFRGFDSERISSSPNIE